MGKRKTKQKQNRRPDISNEHHVARHCHHQRLIRDPETQDITGVFPQEFRLRTERDERYLSVHWMECFSSEPKAQFEFVVDALRSKGRTVGKASAIARLCAGFIADAGREQGHSLRVRDRTDLRNPGYAGIEGMPHDNSDAKLLALFAHPGCIEIRGVESIDTGRTPVAI